jgi:hypothetical protein
MEKPKLLVVGQESLAVRATRVEAEARAQALEAARDALAQLVEAQQRAEDVAALSTLAPPLRAALLRAAVGLRRELPALQAMLTP